VAYPPSLQVLGRWLCLSAVLISGSACAPENWGPFQLELKSQSLFQAGSTPLEFVIWNQARSITVSDADLITVYEKKVHAYVFDESLTDFYHVHPDYSSSTSSWVVAPDLTRNGTYFFWIEGIAKGPSQSETLTLGTQFSVEGGLDSHPVPTALAESLSAADGNSQADLRLSGVPERGKSLQILMSFSRLSGEQPDIGTYLGARVHLTGAHLGTGQLSHAHGMSVEIDGEEKMVLEAYFPLSGDYRLWAEFVDGGELKTLPFAIHVD